MGHLPGFVADPRRLLGLGPQLLQLAEISGLGQRDLKPEICASHCPFQIERRTREARLGLSLLQRGDLLPEPALAEPGKRLGQHEAHEARLGRPDGDRIESIVLDRERQGRVGERSCLRDPRLLGADPGPGLCQLGGRSPSLFQDPAQHRVLRLRSGGGCDH